MKYIKTIYLLYIFFILTNCNRVNPDELHDFNWHQKEPFCNPPRDDKNYKYIKWKFYDSNIFYSDDDALPTVFIDYVPSNEYESASCRGPLFNNYYFDENENLMTIYYSNWSCNGEDQNRKTSEYKVKRIKNKKIILKDLETKCKIVLERD